MSSVATLHRTEKNCEETEKSYTTSSLDLSPNSRKHWNPQCWRNLYLPLLHDCRKHMQIMFPMMALTSGERSCLSPLVFK